MLHTKLIAAAALILTMSTANAFAGPDHGISSQLRKAFQKDFNKSELVDYTSGKDYTRLTLKMNDMIVFAYYSDNGDLLAVTRNIKSTQLPLSLLLDLKKNYTGYWITDLFEMSTNDQSSYFMTIENSDTKVNLKSFDNDGWETIKKTTKE